MSEICKVHLPTEKCPVCQGRGWVANAPGIGGRIPCDCNQYKKYTVVLTYDAWVAENRPKTAEEYWRNRHAESR